MPQRHCMYNYNYGQSVRRMCFIAREEWLERMMATAGIAELFDDKGKYSQRNVK